MQLNTSAIKQKYDFQQPYVKKLGELVNQTLMPFCEGNNYAYTYRYKSLNSLSEKIETGRYTTWESLEDLFAASIIIPDLNDEGNVVDFLSKVFEKEQLKKRGSSYKSSDVFRFDTTRFIGKLRPLKGFNQNQINKINFEIQIRTAFEHAWSVTSHSLTYKTDNIDWKILRLSAQLKASIEQLDMIVMGSKEIHKHITLHKWPELEYKINLLKFFKENFKKNKLPIEVTPKDFSRFCTNVFSLIKTCKDYRKKDTSILIREIEEIFNEEIDSYNVLNFPRSISLFQLIFGIMAKYGKLDLKLKNFTPLITPQLENLFPEVKNFSKRFMFDKN